MKENENATELEPQVALDNNVESNSIISNAKSNSDIITPLYEEDKIKLALSYIKSHDRDVWVKMGMAIKSKLGDGGCDIWDQWSQSAPSYNEQDAQSVWRSIKPHGGVNIGTLYREAQKYGFKAPNEQSYKNPSNIPIAKHRCNMTKSEESRKRKADEAAIIANRIYQNASAVIEHNYLKTKQINPYTAKVINADECEISFWTKDAHGAPIKLNGKLLVIPLYNSNHEIRGLQAIDEQGRKSFQAGISKRGLFYYLCDWKKINESYTGDIYVTEGFSTAASIELASQKPTIMAIDAGNLEPVIGVFKKLCSMANIIGAGDFDKNGSGQRAANKAKELHHIKVIFPPFTAEELAGNSPPSDFNDYYLMHGKTALMTFLNRNLESIPPVNLVSKKQVNLTCASSMNPEPIKWIWNAWLAAGKLHMLAGVAGTGKTTIALSLAAIISRGGEWPDGTKSDPANVLIWSGEDDPNDTLLPRLIAAGVNRENIHFITGVCEVNQKSRSFDPSKDMDELQIKATQLGNVKLIIIDPIVNAVTGDSHKNCEVRRCLQPLVDLGVQLNAAILGITHFTKSTIGRELLDRVTGSLAFGALPRVVLVACKVKDNGSTKHLFARIKSNISIDEGGFYYEIKEVGLSDYPDMRASKVEWGTKTDNNKELLSGNNSSVDECSTLAEAKEFLLTLLSNDSMPVQEVFKLSRESGFAKITINRAKKELGVISSRNGFGKGSSWMWRLPPKPSNIIKNAEDAHTNNMITFGIIDNVRALLESKYTSIVDGYDLEDILSHVELDEYEALLNTECMQALIDSLKKSGSIKKKEKL